MPINPYEAPIGYKAVPEKKARTCCGCAFSDADGSPCKGLCPTAYCARASRADRCHVIFVPTDTVPAKPDDPRSALCDALSDLQKAWLNLGWSYDDVTAKPDDPRSALRKVKYRECVDGDMDNLLDFQEGWFHAWGVNYVPFARGVGNVSVALIETLTGRMVNVLSHNMAFLPEEKSK